jgi:hypothetical protein
VLNGWPQWATLCAHLLSSRVDIGLILGWLIPSEMVTGPTCNYSLSLHSIHTNFVEPTPAQRPTHTDHMPTRYHAEHSAQQEISPMKLLDQDGSDFCGVC